MRWRAHSSSSSSRRNRQAVAQQVSERASGRSLARPTQMAAATRGHLPASERASEMSSVERADGWRNLYCAILSSDRWRDGMSLTKAVCAFCSLARGRRTRHRSIVRPMDRSSASRAQLQCERAHLLHHRTGAPPSRDWNLWIPMERVRMAAGIRTTAAAATQTTDRSATQWAASERSLACSIGSSERVDELINGQLIAGSLVGSHSTRAHSIGRICAIRRRRLGSIGLLFCCVFCAPLAEFQFEPDRIEPDRVASNRMRCDPLIARAISNPFARRAVCRRSAADRLLLGFASSHATTKVCASLTQISACHS